jgi:hypothetical protein
MRLHFLPRCMNRHLLPTSGKVVSGYYVSVYLFKKGKSFFCHRQRQDEVAATCRPLTVRPFGHLKPASPPDRVRGRFAIAGLPGLF